jgi:hypothetical protein
LQRKTLDAPLKNWIEMWCCGKLIRFNVTVTCGAVILLSPNSSTDYLLPFQRPFPSLRPPFKNGFPHCHIPPATSLW